MLLGLPKPVLGFHRAQEVSYVAVGVCWSVPWTEGGEDGHYLRQILAVVLNLGGLLCFFMTEMQTDIGWSCAFPTLL